MADGTIGHSDDPACDGAACVHGVRAVAARLLNWDSESVGLALPRPCHCFA